MKYILVACAAAVVVLASYQMLKSHLIGKLGEYRVAKQLRKLNNSQYRVLNNVIIKTSKGTAEIDHIVVSRKGIYVIETKNRKGIIYGAENWEYWTQKLYNKQHKFYSPIKQNNAHIAALRAVLKNEKVNYYSIIVFIKNANINRLKTLTLVVNDDEVYQTIVRHRGEQVVNDIAAITAKIRKSVVKSLTEKKKHIRAVRRVKRRKKRIKSGVCPRCGHKLIECKKKNGTFYRCSNYPKCKVVIGF